MDISVGTASEATETEPVSERVSGSALCAASTLEMTLESEGAVGCCVSGNDLGALEE